MNFKNKKRMIKSSIIPPKVAQPEYEGSDVLGYNFIVDNYLKLPSEKYYSITCKKVDFTKFLEFLNSSENKERFSYRKTSRQHDTNTNLKLYPTESITIVVDNTNGCIYHFSHGSSAFHPTVGVISIRANYVQEDDICNELVDILKSMNQKISVKKVPRLNIISVNREGYYIKEYDLESTKVDYNLHYNDDLKDTLKLVDEKLTKREKGLFLFHGIPGSGKTTFIKHLTQKYGKRKFIFLPPNMSGQLSSPDFTEFLLSQKESILIIEDAENILKQREAGTNQAISNLLNITDGLLSDLLNIIVICTFNCKHNEIDTALQRKGRLTARYDFGKLTVEKTNNLSKSLGFGELNKQMVLTDIINQSALDFKQSERVKIGF